MAEIRKQLSDKQFASLVQTHDELMAAEQQVAAARHKAQMVLELVLDAVGFSASDRPRLDVPSKTLVLETPDTPEESAPAPSRADAKSLESAPALVTT